MSEQKLLISWNKSNIFLLILVSFILGTFLGSFLFLDGYFLKLAFIGAIIFLVIFWKNKNVKIFALAVVFFVFGWQNVEKKIDFIPTELKSSAFSENVLVTERPVKKDDYQKVVVISEGLGKIIFYVDTFSQINYGDEINLNCQLELPENKDDEFDYVKYLAKDKIFYICKKSRWEKIGERGNLFWRKIFIFKNKIEKIIDKNIPFPESELLAGLLLGKNGSFPKKLTQDFSRTGLTHIVAVSGYNITIIAQYLMLVGILLGLWRKQAFYLSILGILFFIILIGFPASAVRAGLMGGLVLWAMKNGRLGDSKNALILAGAIMLWKNPLLLRWDIGFQLSFLATLGIIYMYPVFQNISFKKEKTLTFFSEILFLTLSAQIFVLPIILYNFGSLSLISLVANLLILPLVPLAMLLGLLLIVFSWLPIFSQIFSWLAFLPLIYETKLASFLAAFPFSSIEVNFPVWGVIIWYIILFIMLAIAKKKTACG